MKYLIIPTAFLFLSLYLNAQNYPEPEFSNEVVYLQKDSSHTLIRLEKGSSKIESKTKMGGMGGYEMGYVLDGEKSIVRIQKAPGYSFVFSTGASVKTVSPEKDSMMRANGMDPSMMDGMNGMGSMNDPANTITLYKTESAKGKRKILMQKAGGAFGSKKPQSSDKYTFSVKKIREGYWELVIDKNLPKGEYAFLITATGMSGMSGDVSLYAFAVL